MQRFEDDFGADDFGAPLNPVQTWRETCPKCNGTGRYYAASRYGRDCFACKGRGYFERKTSPEARAKAKARTHAAKVNAAAQVAQEAQSWRMSHADAAAWIAAKASRFEFAASMAEALAKYGHLTERQLATVERLAAQDAERDAQRAKERAEREAAAPALDVARVAQSLATAQGNGIKRPILRLADFRFSPAPAHGMNAGAIYVKTTSGDYLGKIADGKFKRSFATCTVETESEVVRVASDPEAAAVAYGRRFGQCACCGKELTNAESIERGIGPICAGKFGM